MQGGGGGGGGGNKTSITVPLASDLGFLSGSRARLLTLYCTVQSPGPCHKVNFMLTLHAGNYTKNVGEDGSRAA